jgi:hypothetical protein
LPYSRRKLKAQRKAGEFLSKLDKGKGGGDRKSDHRVQPAPSDYRDTIRNAEIEPTAAKRYQQVAAVPAKQFTEVPGREEGHQ